MVSIDLPEIIKYPLIIKSMKAHPPFWSLKPNRLIGAAQVKEVITANGMQTNRADGKVK